MAESEQPEKQGRGRTRKRRYFRRRRRKGAQNAASTAEQGAVNEDDQPARPARSRNQNRRRGNRRRSSRRRSRAARARAEQAPPAEEESQPKVDVYIYTHVIRPTYKDAGGGEYQADHSLNLSGATASAPVGMDYLLESIGQQLDAWFDPSGDGATEDNGEGEADSPGADAASDGGSQEEEAGFSQGAANGGRADAEESQRE